jgi:D-lactate dehydrogenase
VIDALPQLKYVVTRSTGYDHIDVAYAKTKNIMVASVPAYGTHTVAEFAFALLLEVSRKVGEGNRRVREYADFGFEGLRGFELFGKTMGVIGTGRIGKNSIDIARGFGMRVLAYDVFPDQEFAKSRGFEYVELSTLLAQSDVITLHALYNEKTHHLLNKENMQHIKHGAILINTARGELVETGALVTLLKSGQIAGAGLDVLEGERQLKEEMEVLERGNADFKILFEDHALMDLPNVVVTPHIAFNTHEAVEEIMKTTIENIATFVSGTPKNVIK